MQTVAAQFREEFRCFLRDNLPAGFSGMGSLSGADAERFVRSWRSALAEHGYLAPGWPRRFGGGDHTAAEALIIAEELARVDAPSGNHNDGFGIRLFGNTLLRWGTAAQQAYHLPRIVNGEDVWCQGYSEPNAGSDLANLSTRAELDGDEWVINGQKTWTSRGHTANHMFLLCRTDPTAPRHQGITFLHLDMRQPGVEVRPIHMMSGESEFNEVFLTGARTPAANVVGGVGNGWAVAMTLLGYERGEASVVDAIRYEAEIERLIRLAAQYGKTKDPVVRQRLAWCYSKVQIIKYHSRMIVDAFLAGRAPGPEASLGKLNWSEYHLRVTELAMDIMGADGLVPTGRAPLSVFGPDDPGAPNSTASWATTFLHAHAGTIYAGTSQIQRNIIGEKVLHLPKEPRERSQSG